ncbi:DUF2637 domain-containing protein [Allostreptomyces psammosilenae]|uniref:DUF2637 domain-containing protein n=1 Tax=Allostreptomyces psammosilenae TaxID=1892865 RepID=A0A852ZRY1_9ACTN|nr:DUF2637 domain-containing protein [Allostreptomyces psammosilenae]NYI05109.1 hypothetical protein [Allostreptomyces psammosilenae]
MTNSDIPSGWVLTGAGVVLIAVAVLALLRARNLRAKAAAAGSTDTGDSWERMEERRRRKELVYGIASYVMLFAVAAVAAALSFRGLVGFGRQNLELSGGWEYLVPLGLDGAAMFCSVLAVREASHGDAALGSRLLVWVFAGASAWFNWVHAPRGDEHAGAPQFFAGMSLAAAVLFDRALKQTRRAALREQGLVPRPLPQIRMMRWLRAPRETYGAWSLMLLEGVRTLDEAVEEVREDRRLKQEKRDRQKMISKREKAQAKALQRHGGSRRRGGRQVAALPALPGGGDGLAMEPPAASAGLAEAPAGDKGGREAAAETAARPALERRRPGFSGLGALGSGREGGRPTLEPVPASASDEPSASASGASSGSSWESSGGSGRRSVDLTAEDDTLSLPRLDSLEQKLKDLERQYG